MPSALIYLGIMLAVIIVWFVLFKRPVYEAVLPRSTSTLQSPSANEQDAIFTQTANNGT